MVLGAAHQLDTDSLVGNVTFADVPAQHRIVDFRGIVTRFEAVPLLNFWTSHMAVTVAESA